MKPARFDYHRPASLEEASRLLANGSDARLISGGQSLGPMLNLRLAAPEALVDISGLLELLEIEDGPDEICVGAATLHADFEDGRVPAVLSDMLARAASNIAYRAVRNRGTIGGSLAHADPAADWPPVMVALGAAVTAQSVRGRRTIPAGELIAGAMETTLEDDEIITSIRIPKFGSQATYGHHKIARKPGDFAESLAVVVIDPERGIQRAVLSGNRLSATALRGTSALLGEADRKGADAEAIRSAVVADLAEAGVAEDTSPYILALHQASMARAVQEALGR